uniref:Uncharacterized protein n=1 Tax=Cannabis sativa TaxID=3483 RepID=A0A803QHS5_CANSA
MFRLYLPESCDVVVTLGRSSAAVHVGQVVLMDEEEEEGEIIPPLERKCKGKMVETEHVKKPRRADTPALGADSGIPSEVDEYPVPPGIILTLVHPDEGRGEYVRDIWDFDLDPLIDRFKRFVGPSLAPFTSEMMSHFTADLTKIPLKIYAACAFTYPVYQVQEMSVALTVEVLAARDEIITAARRDLRDSKEEVQELTAKLRSLEELHQNHLNTTPSLTVEVKELPNNFDLRLPFYPKPEEVLAHFWEKKKRLDAVLEERRDPRLPPQVD